MASHFRYLRAASNKSYIQQGEIYFACQNYKQQTEEMKKRIDETCERAGGEYAGALKEYLTTEADWRYICERYYLASATLARIRLRFYELW